MRKRLSYKLKKLMKRSLAAVMISVLGIGMISVTDMYYGYAPNTAYAAELELAGVPSSVNAPKWNVANIPARDTSGKVKYYFAGNEFNALNQLNDGVQQSESGTSGHLKIYSDSGGARLVETTSGSNKAVKGNYSGGSDFGTYSQRSDIDFSKTWELMDTDAIWDNQYLFAQYKTNAFAEVKSAFEPTILNTVENWYENGFSYDGSAASRPSIMASNTSWFSDAEKKAVKSAEVKTDGNEGSSNTNTSDVLSNAHLFAPSIDEMYYNPVQIEKVIENLAADKSDVYNGTGWQCARSYLWSRSFWGVGSSGLRNGFGVGSTGQVHNSSVANECAVAPAFYLDLEQVKMARSAEAGANASANAALAAYNPNGIEGDVKFLVQDSGFAPSFTSSINGKTTSNVVAGHTYSVDYSGGVTAPVNSIGSNSDGKLVISAAVYDDQGKVLYYGPLADASTEGKVNIQIPSGLSKGKSYTLALFEEQLGGTSTWKTKENSNNGNNFTQTNEGTYTQYETDYMSGSVAYMNFNVVSADFDVQINDGGYLYSGKSYSGKEIGEVVKATIGGRALTYSDYYVMKKSDFDSLGSTLFSQVSAAPKVNVIDIDPILTNEESSVDLVFIYYDPDDRSSAQIVYRTLRVVADQIENSIPFDSQTWYQSEENDITWNYKLNSNGDIIGLYTDDSIVKIVDGGKTLNIPAKVAGRTVIGIGSGSEEHPFIPASERSWTSISFPTSVAIIRDYAFCSSSAMANVVIPATITNIGVKAFYGSSIESLKVHGMNGTIGSLAFGDAHALTNVTLKGGESGLTVSTIAFRESNALSVSISGKVTLNKNAFKNNQRLAKIYISGEVTLNDYAFSGCTAVDSLELNGRISVGKYAFNNLTSLEHLYIPESVTVDEYAFNNCTRLNKLEVDTNLVNHAFENCGNIQTLILDEHVTNVAFDWEGHKGNYANRKVYVKNKNTMFEMYGHDENYVSAFGSAGDIVVYILNDQSVDQGKDVQPQGDVLSLLGYTCYAHSLDYKDYITGLATSVTFYSVNNLDTQLSTDDVDVSDGQEEAKQTGIDAYYTGVILTTRDIAEDNMTVIPLYGSNEGMKAYDPEEFYIIRTTEFNELESSQNVTVETVGAYEPVNAKDTDLDMGSETGTISVTVVVFSEDADKGYFSVPVSVRVEKYSDKSYVEQEYGSYENIVQQLAILSQNVESLEAQIAQLKADKNSDTAKINELSTELAAYKRIYEELLETFAEFVSSSETDETGYFGTYEGDDVVFIEGNPISYEDSNSQTEDGKTIYTAQYDTDDDESPETIKFYVDSDGIHLVDDQGHDTGVVYKDELGVIERKTTALFKNIEDALNKSQTDLTGIIDALKDAGYEFDLDVDVDEQYKDIVDAINDMADKIETLESDLDDADSLTMQYERALASIYALLTNSTLDADGISDIKDALFAIISKISSLQGDLSVSQATLQALKESMAAAGSGSETLGSELETTKSQLQKAKDDLAKAQQQKAELESQYEQALSDGDLAEAERLEKEIAEADATITKLTALQETLAQKEHDIEEAQKTFSQLQQQLADKDRRIEDLQSQLDALTDTADGFKITVDTANKMFGFTLPDGSTDKEIAEAIQGYVRDKITSDETISAIQKLLDTDKTGTELVAEVKEVVDKANSSSSGSGSFDDSVVNKNSNNYKQGYQIGYEAGLAAGAAGKTDDTVVNVQSQSYKEGYTVGYNQGYAKAAADLSNASGTGNTGNTDSVNEKLQQQIESLTSQVSSLSSKNSSLQSKLDDLQDDVNDLEDDNNSLKEKNKSLEEKNSSLSSQMSTLNSDMSGLKSTNEKLSSQVTDLSSKNSTLSTQVTDLTAKNSSLTSEVSSLKTQAGNTSSTSSLQTKTTTSTSTSSTKTTTEDKNALSTVSKSNTASDDEDEDKDNEDGDVIEGSTNGLDSKTKVNDTNKPDNMADSTVAVAAENSQNRLGTTSEVSMFSDAAINSIPGTQYASGSVIRFTESNPIVKFSETNGKAINDITEESLDSIYKIFTYYANHLEELGNMGSDDVVNAAHDESKAVILNVVGAGDIEANVTQETAFRNAKSAILTLKAPNITTGALYLVVHERADRAGQYEVCLTTATDNALSLNVSSLSPVAVAKVEIKEATAVVNSTMVEEFDITESDQQAAHSGSNAFRVVMIVLIFILLLGTVGLVVIVKMKSEGRLPKFLSFLNG